MQFLGDFLACHGTVDIRGEILRQVIGLSISPVGTEFDFQRIGIQVE